MTSRPELLQRTASGGAHPVPNRGRPPSHFSSSAPTLRQSEPAVVVDLTLGETDKRLPEASSGKIRTSRPAARNIESKHLSLSGLSLCGNGFQAKFQARGRPQLYFEDATRNEAGGAVATAGAGAGAGAVVAGQQGHAAKTSSSSAGCDFTSQTLAMPLPPRPGMLLREDRAQYEANVLREGAAKRNVKAGGPETPPEALCFPNGKPVDFFPWNGNHPEDALTEAVIKNGFANKPQIMNENGTARPAVWTHLKNKSGLQTLSSLFVAMLEKRQNACRLTAPSSFKPPPRVTLTDTKREAWLRDLANPAIALRRLSRTIPHGIRGKLLLEQCLGKNIPTPRAVWLAKCVGANEMRAFKRKGATGNVGSGSEVKWVKEWTSFVEQFVESIVSTCGQAEWKGKMDYSIRLATHLYNDRLLDSDHYLDWILTSLEGSSSEKLPIWILFIKIYWKDLTGSRRRGSRLAESLLAHVQTLSEPVEDNSMSRLRRSIDQLLLAMLKAFRKCLLLPKTWKAYLPVLQALAGRYPNLDLQKELQHVQRQNERLVNGRAIGTDSTPSQEKEMLSILDTIGHKIDIAALSSRCISVLPEPRQRILFLLRWACSIYRCGEHRIYVALRLLRKWQHMGVEVDKYILEFLATSAQKSDCEVSSAFRIVADLIRSKTFSAGKYLQWLIATGALSNMTGIDDATPCHLRLIAELPFETLPPNVTNLRQTILRHTGLCESEAQALADLQVRFIQDLRTAQDSSQFSTESLEILGSKGIGVKLALSRWLREYVYARSAPPDSPMANDQEDEAIKMSPISLSQFCFIRDALEEAQDFPILADVLGLMLSTSDYSLLGTIADTLHYHSLAFAAIGALVPLLSQLTERYSGLRAEKLPDKPFLRAYVELCTSVRVDPQLLQLLKYDLYRIEQQTNVAVCSPASDNMGDIQSGNMDLDDEFDRILSSGSTMDEQMMGRMFKRLVVRLSQESTKGDSHSAILTSWFPRLRAFDEKTFDRLVQEWVSTLILEQQLPTLHAAIPTLVVSSCFTLDSLADCSTKLLPVLARHHMEAATVTCREILDSVLPGKRPDPLCQPCHAYRYRLMQSKFCADPKNLLQLVRLAIVLARPNDNTAFNSLFTSDKMVMALKPLVLSSPKSIGDLSDQLSKVSPEAQREKFTYLRLIFDALFDPSGRLGLGNVSLPQQVREMVALADEFSLPFCRLEVQTILHQSKTLPDDEGDVWKALSDAIRVLVDKNSPIWFELISGFSDGITRKIRENAEAQILAFVPSSLKADSQALQRLEDLDESALQRHLAVVSFAGPSLGQEGQPQVLASIIERLRMISEFLNVLERTQSPGGEASMVPPPPEVMIKICSWIEVLLRLAVIHRPFFQSGKATASHLAGFLWLLRSLLLNAELQNHMLTLEYIFDVAAFFSDDLTDEMRIQLSKLEGSKGPFDARTAFIFGASPSPDGWLGLISPQLAANQPIASQSNIQASSMQSANGPPSRTSSPVTPNPAARPQTPQHRGIPQKPGLSQQQQPQQQFMNQIQNMQRQTGQSQFSYGQQQQTSSPIQQQFSQPLPLQGQTQQPQQIPTPSATPAHLQPAAKQDLRPVPFTLRRWEILPDPASSAGGNDTALSLTLFGARKVM